MPQEINTQTQVPQEPTDNNSSNLKNKIPKILSIVVLVVLLVIAGYWLVNNRDQSSNITTDQPNEQKPDDGSGDFWSFNLVKPVFAQIQEIANLIKPSVPYSKVSISEISNLDTFSQEDGLVLTDEQKKTLEDYGFFLATNNVTMDQSGWGQFDDFVDMYDSFDGNSNKYLRNADDSVFITSDLALHLYHILIDRSFQKMEESKFQPMLRTMTKALFVDSINKYDAASDPALKDSYKRLSAYYLVPLVVLDAGSNSSGVTLKPEDYPTFAQYLEAVDKQIVANSEGDLKFSLSDKSYDGIQLSDEVYVLAKSELELIQAAESISGSPLFTPLRSDFKNDYSQFKPRSHYTKNDVLKSYFIAMMWYGRMGFPLSSPELTRDALLITGQVNNLKVSDTPLSSMWADMNIVIDFFVGEEDDLNAYQYSNLISQVYGSEVQDTDFSDKNLLSNFITRAKKELPAPKIVSEALAVFDNGGERDKLLEDIKQFRFMGQRFTPDAYIINNLTQGEGTPDPETGQLLPYMPTALMPFRVILPDNFIISQYLDKWINDPVRIEQQGRQSDKIIAKVINMLISEFSEYDEQVWTQNIYWSWLDMFRPLLGKYGDGYPYFMQSESWMKKSLGTVLGSFSELKHDTLLYAKQSYAELGGGGPEDLELPPIVKGYVEPDLSFWNKIITLAEMTETGLKDRDFFPEDFEYKYQTFIDSAKFFRNLAEQELQNKVISEDDFEELRTISADLRRIVEPLAGQEMPLKDKRAGIIADIHTDAVNQEILYQATGKPYIIYVAVKDANGTRLTRGAVYNHYEFTDSLEERLSDEDWQAKVYENNGSLPPADAWSLELVK